MDVKAVLRLAYNNKKSDILHKYLVSITLPSGRAKQKCFIYGLKSSSGGLGGGRG
jgi:hypothetical protein